MTVKKIFANPASLLSAEDLHVIRGGDKIEEIKKDLTDLIDETKKDGPVKLPDGPIKLPEPKPLPSPCDNA